MKMVRALQDNTMVDSRIIMFRSIQRILKIKGLRWIRYVPREGNLVANCLVKLSLAWRSSLKVFEDALNKVLGIG